MIPLSFSFLRKPKTIKGGKAVIATFPPFISMCITTFT